MLLLHNRYRSASPSGEDRVVEQERAALAGAGHDVELLSRSSDEIRGWPAFRKAIVPAQVVWSERSRRSLLRAIRKFRPQVVHVHNVFPLLSASVLYACRAESVPVVASLHNYRLVCPSGDLFRDDAICHDCVTRRLPSPGVRHGCYKGSALATVPLAAGMVAHGRAWRTMVSAYVCLSVAQRNIIVQRGFPSHRLFVKPNFVPPAVDARGDREDIVVYAGRLTANKGIPLLMEAWDRYIRTAGNTRLRLVIAGTGPLQCDIARWAGDRASVEWKGMLSHPASRALLGRARAAVVPSQWEEPFGLVVVEAMAAGVPAVAPRHGSFPELITDGLDGVLFESGSSSSLAAVFHHVEANPDWYDGLGLSARLTYERRFTREANLKQLLRIYRFAEEHPAPAPPDDPYRNPAKDRTPF
ncbi:MAG TPA: glycosyltransferase [Chloroflexota bacterium]|nr:glycosyltransferase [Chloroflexota bacterium]